ncbi:MAG: hypothetical protein AAFR52_03390 [Pseudomonadota bacterium]
MASYEDSLADARDALDEARRRITAEISGYPGPVAGCDAQYNRLLEDRRRITAALTMLETQFFVPTPRQLAPGQPIEQR